MAARSYIALFGSDGWWSTAVGEAGLGRVTLVSIGGWSALSVGSREHEISDPSVPTAVNGELIRHVHAPYTSLVIILVLLVGGHVEESKLIDTLGGRNHPQPISQLLFLQELFGPALRMRKAKRDNSGVPHSQVLEITAGEGLVRDDLNLAVSDLRDLDDIAKVAGAAIDLDAIVQELLERRNVKDFVVGRLRRIDDEL